MRTSLAAFVVYTTLAAASVEGATRLTYEVQSVSINGVNCPELVSWAGGYATGSVIEQVENNAVTKKHINKVSYEPITLTVSPPLSAAVGACLGDLCAGPRIPSPWNSPARTAARFAP